MGLAIVVLGACVTVVVALMVAALAGVARLLAGHRMPIWHRVVAVGAISAIFLVIMGYPDTYAVTGLGLIGTGLVLLAIVGVHRVAHPKPR